MVTIKDMAEMLGISTTTVSNVIHGKTSQVSPKTVERVQKLLEEYDYVPNINARNLAQNQSKIIVVALKARRDKYPNILADPFFGALVGAIEAEIRNQGYFMMLYISNDIQDIMKYISSWNADGLLLVGMLHDDFIRVRSKMKKPMVLLDSYVPEVVKRYVNVGLDDERGAYEMTQYLLSQGHRRIAFLADNVEGVDYIRYKGHERAMMEYGLEPSEEDILIIRPGEDERPDSLREILESSKNYTALMVCSDYYAAIVANYLMDAGVRIPEDISITGFDGNMYSQVIRPAITTMAQDVEKKGTTAVQCLLKLINKEPIKERDIRLPVKLIIRDSVKTLKKADKLDENRTGVELE